MSNIELVLVLCDVIKEAKLPDGVVNMVFGSGMFMRSL